MDPKEEQFKRMVSAYLHDPPHKVLDLGKHDKFTESFVRTTWVDYPEGHENLKLTDKKEEKGEKWDKTPDHAAAAADRVAFPNKKAEAGGKFEGEITHPLGSGTRRLGNLCTVEKAEEDLQNSFGGIKANSWREFFFLLWRRWREETAVLNPDLALYPADTRIPDHTIWNHMDLTAAFEACRNENSGELKPAFLLFQLGPVQEFIAAARSTRDLWSGSYLISWLSAHALKAVTDEIGPSSVIFPALRGLGIFDAVNRKIFQNVSYKDKNHTEMSLWKRVYGAENMESLLNPTVPNRFLALVPASRAKELAEKAEQAVRDELKRIGEHVWKDFLALGASEDWKNRWDKQLEFLPQITWQTLPFYDDIEKAIQSLEKIDKEQAKRMSEFRKLAEESIPEDHRDGRNYRECKQCGESLDKCKHHDKVWKLNRPEFAWSANFAIVSLLLSARRNTREFAQFITDEKQKGSQKDSLTGREEIIGDKDAWNEILKKDKVFRENEEPYGAINILKRLWCEPCENSYMAQALNVNLLQFQKNVRFKSTQELAGSDNYFAVLAMDGDEMGKWISGEKTPPFLDQLKENTRQYFTGKVSDALQRQVSPGYHLQFSETLANFANKIAGNIVKKHGGSLIYAGGDDVMAALPAKTALKCADELRKAFQGENGWYDGMMVPGNECDVSCGIAIAHYKHPLQHTVREAHAAEKRAKDEYDRGAFAVSLLKRGGETIHWGAKWNSGALELFYQYCELRKDDKISSRFPYKLAEVLAPYQLGDKDKILPDFPVTDIIKREFDEALARSVSDKDTKIDYAKYLEKCKPDDFVKLFLTAVFIERSRGEE